MRMPRYLKNRYSKRLPPEKVWAARCLYGAKLEEMGIVPGTELYEYFCCGKFSFKPCKMGFEVDMHGKCSITFYFSTHEHMYIHPGDKLEVVKVTFGGVQNLQCRLFDSGIHKYRDYLWASIWEDRGKKCICITVTSGDNDYSDIMFSFDSLFIKRRYKMIKRKEGPLKKLYDDFYRALK